ncbi:hypothetical protein NVV94_09705 [Pseudomonas sp. LS1212]|uniref:hypothetical protein n=1 Tax=Pseudomonas sp. LS1212 TaxID=2972478 RepID=UPI00215C081E|nr:hypothetical protein [Pseudomonas sp. LS1212]UVJ45790.1 hypothetical protein NVV94_09705 [Pseudomonas sp. LS1212]
MNRMLATALLIAMTILAGCASGPGPESRRHTAEETRQLALEALNRRGLSFDEYHRLKAQLQREQPQAYGFEGMGQVNAERAQVTHGRQG